MMANTDIRIDINFCDNPKTKRLIRELEYEGFFCIVKLWAAAARLYPKGVLLKCDCIDIADLAGWSGDAELFCNTLVNEKTNFLDLEDGVYSLHDWEENQQWVYFSEERSDAARALAKTRWENKDIKAKTTKETPLNANSNALRNALRNADGNAICNAPSPSPSPLPLPKERREDTYGEFKNVLLSKEEFEKCIDKHTAVITYKAIEKLSSFKESNGKVYKSDYAALNTWVWDALNKKPSEKISDVHVDNNLKYGGFDD